MIKSYLIIVMCLLLTVDSATGQTLNVDSCYALAVKNYPLIKQYNLIEKTKEYTLSNAGKAYLPQVSITGIAGYIFGGFPGTSDGNNFKFIGIGQVNQTLWDGGATKTQKSIINASSETEKASVDVALYDLRSRVSQLYFGVLLVDEQLKQLQIQDTILSNNINRIKLLNDNGLAYKTDVDEIKVERLKLSQQRREYNYTRNGYITMLSLLTAVKINEQAEFEKPLQSSLLVDMQTIRPELSLYKSQRNLVNAQAGMRKVNLMPKIGLLGAGVVLAPGINLGAGNLSAIGVAGLSASWSISGLYKNSNEKQLIQQELDKINVREETFLFNTKFQSTQSSANIDKQKAILAEDDEIVSLRQTIREGYQLKYNSGAGPLIDLLNATQKESEARAQKALHEMQLLMTEYEYKTITGN
jgi:outer membrane protein TolC